MITSNHYIELLVNGEEVELKSQEGLNLRINKVVFNPAKNTTTASEYSYSFEIPSTPRNNKIFDHANVLSKLNKFHTRYHGEVVADGETVFQGSLTIEKYNARDRMYTCNLVNIKVNTLDEIFGDDTFKDMKWLVDYDGVPSINAANGSMGGNDKSKYFFPLVCYGVGQKNPVSGDTVGNVYTSKFSFDKYNKWWHSSFFPSLNVMETVKRCFEAKGYKVGGTAFHEPYISEIYASCNLADDQVPTYNVGRSEMGKVSLSFKWQNTATQSNADRTVNTKMGGGWLQDLKFPYQKVTPAVNASNQTSEPQYNCATVELWNMLSTASFSGNQVIVKEKTYIYDPNEEYIVIPSDGWYRINLKVVATLSGNETTFSAKQWTTTFKEQEPFQERNVTITRNARYDTPLEIQLIRNYADDAEMIKGDWNHIYDTGDPSQTAYRYQGPSYTGSPIANLNTWRTHYPHEDPYGSRLPTITDGFVTQEQLSANAQDKPHFTIAENNAAASSNTTRAGHFGNGNRNPSSSSTMSKQSAFGYFRGSYDEVFLYDPAVNPNFICGFSTLGQGCASVLKDGRSWNRTSAVNGQSLYNCSGYTLINKDSQGNTALTPTSLYTNKYNNSSCSYGEMYGVMSGQVQTCVYLQKNDVLSLLALQRDYNKQAYSWTVVGDLDIEAISPRTETELKSDDNFGYFSTSEFPKQLNLFNFANSETKVSEWIQNIQRAFNLDIVQDGTNIEINTNKGVRKNISTAVDIDDRTSHDDAVSEMIDYPREMSVKYKINTDEWGFETTVSPDHLNDEGDEWKKWGDSGYTVIQLSDDSYSTAKETTQTQFSYTWYDDFNWKQVGSDGEEIENSTAATEVMIPVIEKSEYMADGYGYEEAMKHDGYGLTQRFWYPNVGAYPGLYVYLSDSNHEALYPAFTANALSGFNLSYKDTEKSLMTEYFNVSPLLSSNFVTLEAYITPTEYKLLKDGALVRYDSDLYYVSEISGYDPSGKNKAELKLVKKV